MLKEIDNKPHASFFNRIKGRLAFLVIGSTLIYALAYLTGNNEGNKETIVKKSLSGRIVSIKTSGFLRVIRSPTVEVSMKLSNMNETVSIKPRSNSNNTPSNFENFTMIGDSVFKESNSDWIYVVRDGQRYEWHIPL